MNIQGFDPRTGAATGTTIAETTSADVDAICTIASKAFAHWSRVPAKTRAAALNHVASAIGANAVELVEVADRETALDTSFIHGEITRTIYQLCLLADALHESSHLGVLPGGKKLGIDSPRSNLRCMLQPIGPVAAFAACNSSFEFSVAGGNAASALAAGCSVVVKANEAQPRTTQLTARIVTEALAQAGAPQGILAVVYGTAAGMHLVRQPAIKAVGFTGSPRGGRVLFDMTNARPTPIPFHGELGGVNPALFLPNAAAERRDELARGFAMALTSRIGQSRTSPSLVFAPIGMVDALVNAVEQTAGGAMLSKCIRDEYIAYTQTLIRTTMPIADGMRSDAAYGVAPRLFHVDIDTFEMHVERYSEECFGPAALVVSYSDPENVIEMLSRLPESSAASIHGSDADALLAARALDAMRGIAGKIFYNTWPTDTAIATGMQHGGIWPSTTNPLPIPMGATSIHRWLVPVSLQGWPDTLLPEELKTTNSFDSPRRRGRAPERAT